MSKRSKIVFLLIAIIVFCWLAAIFLPRIYTVPIIMYHYVRSYVGPGDRLTISTATFERQMRFLKEHKYNVVSLDDIVSLIKEGKKIPPKTIAITFDDGSVDNFVCAFPILKKYQLPATMFVITQEVGRVKPKRDKLTWKHIKVMQESGLITIGSHAIGPNPLVKIKSEQELRRQIFDSKKILEEKLSRPINFFSYPEGFFNKHIRDLVIAAGYKGAVATSPGKRYPNNDIFALKRLRISENTRNLLIFWFETTGYYKFTQEIRKK